ncbi:hypothetical protein NDU88_004868 [Pleurodeles waltl]|uniref:Uncharacterized protein n=1 Tax=Pleurodeles waltl TaxID=8319 RepID=A0AAV7T9C0_PLEWA|nr:hypothetical protein NDU88_004868 [Pleurodeles waltl]
MQGQSSVLLWSEVFGEVALELGGCGKCTHEPCSNPLVLTENAEKYNFFQKELYSSRGGAPLTSARLPQLSPAGSLRESGRRRNLSRTAPSDRRAGAAPLTRSFLPGSGRSGSPARGGLRPRLLKTFAAPLAQSDHAERSHRISLGPAGQAHPRPPSCRSGQSGRSEGTGSEILNRSPRPAPQGSEGREEVWNGVFHPARPL